MSLHCRHPLATPVWASLCLLLTTLTTPTATTCQVDEDQDAHSIAAYMAPQRAAASRVGQLALFRAVPQHAWLAARLVSQWVGPEAAVSDGAVRRWAPVADVVKEACR